MCLQNRVLYVLGSPATGQLVALKRRPHIRESVIPPSRGKEGVGCPPAPLGFAELPLSPPPAMAAFPEYHYWLGRTFKRTLSAPPSPLPQFRRGTPHDFSHIQLPRHAFALPTRLRCADHSQHPPRMKTYTAPRDTLSTQLRFSPCNELVAAETFNIQHHNTCRPPPTRRVLISQP